MSYKAILSTKITLVALGLLLIFFANVKYKQYKNQKNIENEKQLIMEQIDSKERKNKELSDSLNLLSGPDHKERVARQQFNLKKDGELVYNFTEKPATSAQTINTTEQGLPQGNPQKWWNYFFNN
jgi:cell division protein FtsB